MDKIDRELNAVKRLQEEMERRTQIECEAERLICEGRFAAAGELLATLDDSVVKALVGDAEAAGGEEKRTCGTDMQQERENDMTEQERAGMEKYSSYHIQTDGFEKVLTGLFHMVQIVPLDRKCRVILDYDPALPKVSIETFTDNSDKGQVQEKPFQWVLYDPTSR
jgi:hypothetical protein